MVQEVEGASVAVVAGEEGEGSVGEGSVEEEQEEGGAFEVAASEAEVYILQVIAEKDLLF